MTTTGRDRVWSLALRIAARRDERQYLREVTPEAVSNAADEAGLSVSLRTVRRVLDAMADTGVLVDVSDGENRKYRRTASVSWPPSTDMSSGDSSFPATDMASGSREVNDISVAGATSGDSATDMSPTRREADSSSDATPELASAAETAADSNADLVDDRPVIYHLFADTGVESEPLSAYGRVVRVGLDPRSTGFGDVVRGDVTSLPLRDDADLAVFHPPCQRWAAPTRIRGDREEHPNLIPDARRIGERVADHYIIENVPAAPLDDPVVLDGGMFNLPVAYPRAFETSFPVRQPDSRPERPCPEPFLKADGQIGCFRGDARFWRPVKQVSGDYPAGPLKRSGIPAPYIHYLLEFWQYAREGVDVELEVEGSTLDAFAATDGGEGE